MLGQGPWPGITLVLGADGGKFPLVLRGAEEPHPSTTWSGARCVHQGLWLSLHVFP